MKKIIVVLLTLSLLILVLTGCSSAASPTTAWAKDEVLSYDIAKTDTKENIGTMTITTVRTTDNTLNGKTYASDSKTTILLQTDEVKISTTILSKSYTALAISKEYIDLTNEANNYTLQARQSGKNYVYSINGSKESKLKTSGSYTFNEFLYQYIRCYSIGSLPSSIKIADAVNKKVVTVKATNTGSKELLTINFPESDGGAKEVQCNIVSISLTSKPIGSAILVSYIPDAANYNIKGFSTVPSKKIPAKIVENDITYTLKSIKVTELA